MTDSVGELGHPKMISRKSIKSNAMGVRRKVGSRQSAVGSMRSALSSRRFAVDSIIYTDIQNFATGYLSTDIDGNNAIDLSDLTTTFNNSTNFIVKITP